MIQGFRVMEDRGDAWYPIAWSWHFTEAVKLFIEAMKVTSLPLILIDPRDNTLRDNNLYPFETNVSQLTDKRPTTPHNDK